MAARQPYGKPERTTEPRPQGSATTNGPCTPLKTGVEIIDSTRPAFLARPLAHARGYGSPSSAALVGTPYWVIGGQKNRALVLAALRIHPRRVLRPSADLPTAGRPVRKAARTIPGRKLQPCRRRDCAPSRPSPARWRRARQNSGILRLARARGRDRAGLIL